MPPRLRCPAGCGLKSATTITGASRRRTIAAASHSALLLPSSLSTPTVPTSTRQFSSTAPILNSLSSLRLPDDYIPPTTPPTARPADVRKAQLLRTYTSLLRSTPLMLIFQHNNLVASEWAAIRRELNLALAAVPVPEGSPDIASKIQLQVIRTRMFDVALKVVEFYDPSTVAPTTGVTASGKKTTVTYNHDLSKSAYDAIKAATASGSTTPESSPYAQLSPLLVGPTALLTIPTVSPAHLAAALGILSPVPKMFPAPSKRKSPGYYDPIAQAGLQKLMLIGGRVEGKVFDIDGMRWVGGIPGGLEGLRAQLVAMLQSVGMGLAGTLEAPGKSLWMTMESRKIMLEEPEKKAVEGEKKEESS
ncbi:hypothetical protein B0T17DRAFT_83821 [Bombardia bombarda]|uniref:Uncharacterized protein n=1 Tax=Bombardia bombarda TaxID=252184 RepID=A0AA39XM16_9PEZI|nr:hypothetical protein B0T17DRAFT_83821 [Bombardia bombarda]